MGNPFNQPLHSFLREDEGAEDLQRVFHCLFVFSSFHLHHKKIGKKNWAFLLHSQQVVNLFVIFYSRAEGAH